MLKTFLLPLLLIPHLLYAQLQKVFMPEMVLMTGERFELKPNGTYHFKEWGCLQTTSGHGTYKLNNDTLTITSYKLDNLPFEIRRSVNKLHTEELHIHIDDTYTKLIERISINNKTVYKHTANRGKPGIEIISPIPKNNIKSIAIYYIGPEYASDSINLAYNDCTDIYVQIDACKGYLRPVSLSMRWKIKGDTIYSTENDHYLVDSTLSRDLFIEEK